MRSIALWSWMGITLFLVDVGQCDPNVIHDVAEASYRAGEDESPREAKQKAKDLALRGFVERVVGAHVRIESLAENTHVIYSMVDVWAVANVRIDSVAHSRYADYTAEYRAQVSVERAKVDDLLKAFDEIAAAAVAAKKSEIAERTRRRYAIIGEIKDLVLVPAYRDDPPFLIMRHPVSVWEYAKYAPGYRSDGVLATPVSGVSWKNAQSYCQSKGMRLPQEAKFEWLRAKMHTDSLGIAFSIHREWVALGSDKQQREDKQPAIKSLTYPTFIEDPPPLIERIFVRIFEPHMRGWDLGFRCAQDVILGQ